jgi:hypothetical protein
MSDPVGRPRRSREATRQLWAERLSRFAAADVSAATFCAAEGISSNSFFESVRPIAWLSGRKAATGEREVGCKLGCEIENPTRRRDDLIARQHPRGGQPSLLRRLPVVRNQLVESPHRRCRQATQHVLQIRQRLDVQSVGPCGK